MATKDPTVPIKVRTLYLYRNNSETPIPDDKPCAGVITKYGTHWIDGEMVTGAFEEAKVLIDSGWPLAQDGMRVYLLRRKVGMPGHETIGIVGKDFIVDPGA